MQHSPTAQATAMSLDQLENTALNVVDALCSIVSMPVELMLRPWHGTRYFPVSVRFFASVMMRTMSRLSSAEVFTPTSYPTYTYVQRDDLHHERLLREWTRSSNMIASISGRSRYVRNTGPVSARRVPIRRVRSSSLSCRVRSSWRRRFMRMPACFSARCW